MSLSPLKLYVPVEHIIPGKLYIPLLYARLGFLDNENTPWTSAAWKKHGYDNTYFSFVSDIADADYVVVPHDYREITKSFPAVFNVIAKEAAKAKKPLIANNTGDTPGPKLANCVVLRAGDYKFCARSDVIVVPYPVEDLVETYCGGSFEVRKKNPIPSIGFVGWSKIPFLSRLKIFKSEYGMRFRSLLDGRFSTRTKGIFWREKALASLRRTKGIELRILERAVFGARKDVMEGVADIDTWRAEFVAQIRDTDYTLCVKGDENASFRLYETLSMGRIPVLLDTECVLPLADSIDYQSFCVMVSHKDVKRIGEIVRTFHENISPHAFEAMQHRAREAFLIYLRMDAFTPHLVTQLRAHSERKLK